MGLFHHLFKPRQDEGVEKMVGNSPGATGAQDGDLPEKPAGTAIEGASPPPDPTAFLQPKEFIHRAPTPPPATRIAGPLRPPERRGATPSGMPREITLTLGDILSHVPTPYLKPGLHDATRELRFATGDLTSDIARGRPTVPLSRIAAQCPDVFHSDIAPADDIPIRLPLQKLLDQLGLYTPREVSPPARVLAPVEEQAQPGGPGIRLGLAAILAHCPDALFAGERPRVDAAAAIVLPLAPIERQLAGGRVEISAAHFIARLPPEYAQHFAAREGARIVLPLDEIFRNLPGGTAPDAEPAPATPSLHPEPQAEAPAPPPTAPGPAAPSHPVNRQPPPTIRPMILPPPPLFATAAAEPPRESAPLVPPPFAFSAPLPAPGPDMPPGALDQDALQALFMIDEPLDLPKLARLAAALPGMEACVFILRGDIIRYGRLPLESDALAAMAAHLAALRAPGPVACVTVATAQHSLSFFIRDGLSLCAIHGPRAFLPGVREKLAALADALART